MNWPYVLGGLLLLLGAILLVSAIASRFNPSEERAGLSGESAYCFLCHLTLRAGDRPSHDAVCPGLLQRRRLTHHRTTLVLFQQNGQVRVTKVVGPFAFFGMEVSEMTHGNGPDGLRRALEQVGAEMGEGA